MMGKDKAPSSLLNPAVARANAGRPGRGPTGRA